jgi:hypothetical protein
MEKYQVIFWDINYDEYPVKQLFNSEQEAEKWVENKEWEEDYYAYNEEKGGDYLEYRTRYFNPEDKENYYGYEIKQIPSELNEEFYKMQKLAGLITEEEYKARLWYKQYSENISKALDDLKQTLKNEGYDVK